ncbi:MAG TPA: dihydropteroate synthase [Gemmatimonadales bacterium]
MIVRPLSDRADAVRDALLSHGWGGDFARLTADGLATSAVHVTGLDTDAIEAMLVLAPKLGLELVTGDDWILLAGGRSRLGAFARPWMQPEAVRELAHAVGVAMPAAEPPAWQHARGALVMNRPYLVGILNVTPDSFSDGGSHWLAAAALRHVDLLLTGGAAMIDIGGESTRPGAQPVDSATEQERILPVLREILVRHPTLVVSVDTMHADTAHAALACGAAVINDVTAGRHDPALLGEVAQSGAGLVLSHSRGAAGSLASYDLADYHDDVTGAVAGELQQAVAAATACGVDAGHVAIDPGFGFAKTASQSLTILQQLDGIAAIGLPLMVGLSRKRFLGDATGREVDDRDRATAAACALAYERGARLFRVHDPAAVRDALAVAAALSGQSAEQ